MPLPAEERAPYLPAGLQRGLLCLGILDLTAVSVLGLMEALYAPPFTATGGLAFPLLPLVLARLADIWGLARPAKPGRDQLVTSCVVSAVQVCLAAMAATLYGRGGLREPTIACLGLAGGEAGILAVAVAALATRRRWWGGPPATAAAGTGRPAGLATSESTVALTALTDQPSHPSPTKNFAALIVQPSGASFALAAVADGTVVAPRPAAV